MRYLLLLSLIACAPTVQVSISPTGQPGYTIACPRNALECPALAGRYCPLGYTILERHARDMWIACAAPQLPGYPPTPLVQSPGF